MKNFIALVSIVGIFIIHSSIAKEIQEGWPVAISCDGFESDSFQPKEEVLCQVEQNSSVVFNETIVWEDRGETEYVFDVQRNETVTVYVIRGNRTFHRNETIFVQKPYDICLTNMKAKSDSIPVSQVNTQFPCKVPTYRVPKSKLKELNFIFMKDCQIINATDNLSFVRSTWPFVIGLLEMKHVSYGETPGVYQCVILYRGRQYIFPEMETVPVCITANRAPGLANIPSITPGNKVYHAEPGSNLTMECFSPGQATDRSNIKVVWEKNGTEHAPWKSDKGAKRRKFWEVFFNVTRCRPDSNANATEFQERAGDVTFFYTLSNVQVSDSGTYSCSLRRGKKDTARSNFTVVIKPSATKYVQGWIIAVIVVGACLVIVIFTVVLRVGLRREIRFLMKKYFTKPILVTGDESMAFLVYCEDVFRGNREENPLKDVVAWMEQTNTPYIDPNKHCPEMTPEDPVAENIKEVIKGSKSLIIILSKDLLMKNEMEILTGYMALNSNVESSQSIIFICTKEMKNILFGKGNVADIGLEASDKEAVEKTITTFKNFMKRKGNFVISWSPQKISHFRKDLFVAVPKVKICKKSSEDETILVSNGLV